MRKRRVAGRATTRRHFLAAGAVIGGAGGAALFGAPAVAAMPDALQAVIGAITKGAAPREGRVTVDVPALAETGNSVPATISVASAMQGEDRVRAIHILLERNPEPGAAHFVLGPRCAKAEVATRLRMFSPQRVYGLAEMADGSFWIGSAHVEITLAACVDVDFQ